MVLAVVRLDCGGRVTIRHVEGSRELSEGLIGIRHGGHTLVEAYSHQSEPARVFHPRLFSVRHDYLGPLVYVIVRKYGAIAVRPPGFSQGIVNHTLNIRQPDQVTGKVWWHGTTSCSSFARRHLRGHIQRCGGVWETNGLVMLIMS